MCLFLINSDLIELVEETPDTVITMTDGKKYLVSERSQVILERIIAFKRSCFRDLPSCYPVERKDKL